MSYLVTVVPYQDSWAQEFAQEAALISNALGPALTALHHIGSTAIAGIHAKPIIDIMPVAATLEALDERAAAMEEIGYEVMGEFGIPGRRYFRKNNASGIRTHHIHAFAQGSPELRRHLAFRDYMRAHPDAAQAYSDLKQRLAETCGGDIEVYMDGKNAFVKEMEGRAMAWEEAKS